MRRLKRPAPAASRRPTLPLMRGAGNDEERRSVPQGPADAARQFLASRSLAYCKTSDKRRPGGNSGGSRHKARHGGKTVREAPARNRECVKEAQEGSVRLARITAINCSGFMGLARRGISISTREYSNAREPLRPEAVTYVAGTFCYPCVRVGPSLNGGPGWT